LQAEEIWICAPGQATISTIFTDDGDVAARQKAASFSLDQVIE